MKFRPGWIPHSRPKATDAAANTNTAATYFGKSPCDAEVVEVDFIPDSTLTAHDSNYATLTVKKNGSTTVASITTKTSASGGSGNWTAGTEVPLTVVTTGASELAEDDTLELEIQKSGTGVVVPAGIIQAHTRPRKRPL